MLHYYRKTVILNPIIFLILQQLNAMKSIESLQNALIKSLVQLQEKARARRQSGTFLMEGLREIELAKAGGYQFDTLLFRPDLVSEQKVNELATAHTDRIAISREVYEKLAYRDSTEGLLAVAQSKPLLLEDLQLPPNPLILVAEAPEKPGNIGALLRTADAAAANAVIIADPKGDLYNPNVIRSSVGCLFTVPVATAPTAEVLAFLAARDISIYAATLQNSNRYDLVDYRTPTALVVGTEDNGLSQAWRDAATRNVIIPMLGAIDSMNVSVAAAILIFEARRQRGFEM